MLTVTEHAKATLARLKRQCEIEDDDVALRLSLAASLEPGQGQFGLRVDRESPGRSGRRVRRDQGSARGGRLADALSDATIDAEPGDDLVITRSGPFHTENGLEGGAR